MIKLGVNSVLFKTLSFADAAKAVKACGYDGIEISAIKGMCEHYDPENWRAQKADIKAVIEQTGLEILSCEVASLDRDRLEQAFEGGAEIGIPVFNVGPGGASNDEETLKHSLETLANLAQLAKSYNVTLCCKAHVGSAIFNTPTTLRAMNYIKNSSFGVDMDPSHIYRAGEQPENALADVITSMKHIHIRDCIGRGPSPGTPEQQICGTGDINLFGYFKAMVDAKYNGPVCLEVIGPDRDVTQASIIAAESYGYMNACLKILGAR